MTIFSSKIPLNLVEAILEHSNLYYCNCILSPSFINSNLLYNCIIFCMKKVVKLEGKQSLLNTGLIM